VTDPTAFSASKVMWEFTQTDDSDMGNVVGRPQFLKLRTSPLTSATATYKWFAVVGSGVNNASGTPTLFLLTLDKPAGTAWTLGTNYYKISFPVDAAQAALTPDGLINFSATPEADGVVSRVYAGDLHGKMWKLDFRPYGTAGWNMNNLSAFHSNASTPIPLYIAKDASGVAQPISLSPSIVRNFLTGDFYVAFGTGKFLEKPDKTSVTTQTFYAVLDNQSSVADSSPALSVINGRGRLIKGDLTTTPGQITISAFKWGRPLSDGDTSIRSGYYFEYPNSGERQISDMTLTGNTLVFGSIIPGTLQAGCVLAGEGGTEYHVDIDTGSGANSIYKPSTVGLLGTPIILDVNPATTFTTSDTTGRRTRTTTSIVVLSGSTGIATSLTNLITVIAGRLSWRQINNYQDLKNIP